MIELERYERPDLGFSVGLPAGADVVEGYQGAAVVAVEPAPPGAFRASVNVVVEELASGVGFDAYVEESFAAQRETLAAFHLIDRLPERLGGAPALRTLAHHDASGVPVVLEQWRAPAAPRGYVLSATCSPLEYDELADAFAAVAESFELR